MSEETKEEEENTSEGESSETSEDGYIEQSFEVMFISDKDTPNCNKVVIEKSKKQKAKSYIGIN